MRVVKHIRSEEGAMIVVAAILMVALIGMGAVVVQVGSWYQNRRHIQMRTDAAALAGAQMFNECFAPAPGLTPLADMEEWAKRYGGFASSVGAPQNTQFGVGSSDSNDYVFQSRTYPGGGHPDDTYTANPDPCSAANIADPHGGFDVKLRQKSVRRLFRFSSTATVYGHARVQLKEVQSVVPTFPLAVPEIVPGAVAVTFVNENTGTELGACSGVAGSGVTVVAGSGCTFRLENITTANGGSDPFNLGPWCVAKTDPASHTRVCASLASLKLPGFGADTTTAATHIGMRVGVGDATALGTCAGVGNGSNWQCFSTSSANGVLMIDDVNPAVTAFPKLRGVWPITCSGSPFAGNDSLPVPCGATLTAQITFAAGQNLATTHVQAQVTQTGGATQTIDLARNAAGLWTAPLNSATVTVNPATGGSEYSIDLCWKATNNGKFTCPAGWAGIQRVVGASNTDDGPLDTVSLTDATAPNGPYSYTGASAATTQTVGISVLLKAPFNKLTILRQSHSGSATAFILCRWKTAPNPYATPPVLGVTDNGQSALSASMQSGCQVPYQVNGAKPPTCSPDPLSDPAKSDTPDCTQNKPCSSCGNTISSSLDARFGCANNQAPTYPNRWPNYSTPGDKRAVTLVTTTYGAFQDNGNSQYPVTGFGAFYIAGYSGNNCGDAWPSQLGPEPNKNSGTIWGYFIKYTNNDGTPSGTACQLNSLDNCVAVLTR